MAAYPAYGLFLFDGYSEKPESSVIRSQMESGPPKQAKVKSKLRVVRPAKYRYSHAEYLTFKVFVKTTLFLGADWFDWKDPVDGATKQGRIVDGVYEGKAVKIGEQQLPDWVVSFDLETLE